MNATVHGLRAAELCVLPHEDPQEVTRFVETTLHDLGVQTEIEIDLGKSIALKRLQLRRIERAEARRLESEIGLRLDDTEEAKTLSVIEGAISALSLMGEVMVSAIPADRDALEQLLIPISAVLKMLENVEATGPKVFVHHRELAAAVDQLRILSPSTTDSLAYADVVGKAALASSAVQALLPGARMAAETAKQALVASMPMPDDRDVALRARYAKEIARRIESELKVLALLHERRATLAASGSLGQPVSVMVRLLG